MRAPRLLLSPGQRLAVLKGWPLLGCALGFTLAWFAWPGGVPAPWAEYVSLAALSGLDSALGGARAGAEHRFRRDVFVSGLCMNMLLSVGLIWIGSMIGVTDLYLAAVVVLGTRIFNNVAMMRRHIIDQISAGASQ